MSGLESNRFETRLPFHPTEIEQNTAESLKTGHWLNARVIEGDAKATICFQNALVLIENDEYELAKNLLGAVVNLHSHCPQAIYWLGHCFGQLEQLESALACYRSLQKRYDDGPANFHLAGIHYRLGNDDEAYRHYLRALRMAESADDMLFEIYKNTGNIMIKAGDIDGAVESYNKAFRLRPDSDVLVINLGTACLQKEDLNQAIEYFRQAVQLNPNNDRAWVGLATVHRMFYDHELSWANLELALECNPFNRTAVLLSVEWAKRDGKIASIRRALENYLDKNETDEELVFLHAQVLYACGDLRAARWEVERAMALDPMVRGGSTLLEMIRREASLNG